MTYEGIDKLSAKQIDDLYNLFQHEWWTKGRQLPHIRRMLQNSDVIVAFCDPKTKQLIAFARIITDFVYKALILDVIIDSSHRNQGIGRNLMEMIVEHRLLNSVEHFELYCQPDMVPFYQKWGFTDDLGELRIDETSIGLLKSPTMRVRLRRECR